MVAFVFLILLVLFAAVVALNDKASSEETHVEWGAHSHFRIGTYTAGLTSENGGSGCECLVTEDNFIFIGGFNRKLGVISRDSVNEVIVEDKTNIRQRITATRILALGIFSLAAPKKVVDKEYCLMIDWDGANGVRQNSLFGFAGPDGLKDANKAANDLRQACKPKRIAIRPDEKKCPFCAETIKREATFCRYCQREL